MPQADVSKLVSQLRIKVYPGHRRLKNPKGPEGRVEIIRKLLTGLFKYERIELIYTKADETRGYAERLISEAIRHGDCHKPTMELADFWLEDKTVVHKLFKVLVPRFENCNTAYTRIHKLSQQYPLGRYPRSVLELRGNPFPPLTKDTSSNYNLIHNILLEEAKKEYRTQKYAEMAESISRPSDSETDSESKLSTENEVSKQEQQTEDLNSEKDAPK